MVCGLILENEFGTSDGQYYLANDVDGPFEGV